MAFTNTGSAGILNGLIGKISSGPLSNCYMALSSTAPSPDGTNFTEPSSASGYARAIVGLYSQTATQTMTSPTEGVTQNKDIIFFPEATVAWGTLTHFGLYSSPTGGSLILYGELTTPINVALNYVPLFRVGNFSLNLN